MAAEEGLLPGLITRAQSGFFTVQTERGPIVCQLRGRLKRPRREADLAAVGDRVSVRLVGQDTGMIEAIEPRQRALSRRDPRPQGFFEQVIVANPDQAVFVFACADPAPRLRMLDRFLVTAERQELPAIICANKIDLVGLRAARQIFGLYERLGYPVFYVSAKTGRGVPALRKVLLGRLSVLAGPSGAGKSSLLNAVQAGLGLRTREVRRRTRKGRHTTVVPELIPLEGGGYVADTPGLKAMGLWDVLPEELDACFPEMRPWLGRCEFNDCTHIHEPGCAVMQAVERGKIDPARYESYVSLRLGQGE